MDNALLDIIEEIIEILEDDNYDAYVYNNNKFTFIDKYNNIDFEAKLSNNNYYFKDNISGISFMKTKNNVKLMAKSMIRIMIIFLWVGIQRLLKSIIVTINFL